MEKIKGLVRLFLDWEIGQEIHDYRVHGYDPVKLPFYKDFLLRDQREIKQARIKWQQQKK